MRYASQLALATDRFSFVRTIKLGPGFTLLALSRVAVFRLQAPEDLCMSEERTGPVVAVQKLLEANTSPSVELVCLPGAI